MADELDLSAVRLKFFTLTFQVLPANLDPLVRRRTENKVMVTTAAQLNCIASYSRHQFAVPAVSSKEIATCVDVEQVSDHHHTSRRLNGYSS
jgi:hypothetical protein